jgi:MFS family permease
MIVEQLDLHTTPETAPRRTNQKRANRPKKNSVTREAIHNTILAQATGLILPQVLFQGGVISLLVLTLGGSEFEIGIIFTVFNLCAIVQLFAAPYVDVGSKKKILYVSLFAAAVIISLIFLIYPIDRFLGDKATLWFLVALVFGYSAAVNVATASWFPLLTDIIPARIRGRFFGRMRMLWQLTSFLVTVLSGWFLGSNPTLARFYLVFTLGIVFHFARLYFIRRLPDPPPPRTGPPESLFRNLGRPLRDREFRTFLVFIFLVFGLNAATIPFVIPFLKSDLGFPSSLSVYAAASIAFGSVLSLVWWGKLADRFGNRFVFLLSIVITAASFVVFALTPPFGFDPRRAFIKAAVGFTLQGIGASGLGIGHTVRMMYEAPAEHRGSYMALVGVAIGLFTGIGPLLAGLALEHLPATLTLPGMQVLTKRFFFVTLALLTVSTLALLRRLRPIAERRTQEILKSLVYILPSRVGAQLVTLGRIVRVNRNRRFRRKENAANAEAG